MLSHLLADEPVLQAVLDDQDRISRTQHRFSEATRRVQVALLIWDPGCLPEHGPTATRPGVHPRRHRGPGY
jgi:hypothetical protein